MKRGRLPLTALRSFEAAGRHLSFTRAAEELFISQAAISRQVRELETLLGAALFERRHRSVRLTGAGKTLLGVLTDAFDAIGDGLDQIGDTARARRIAISCEPAFAANWLVPHLAEFQMLYPDIDVDIDPDPRIVDFRGKGPALAIRYSLATTQWPRVESRPLVAVDIGPVIAPARLTENPVTTPRDLLRHPLLHEDSRDIWQQWFAAAGVTDAETNHGPVYGDCGLTLQAAMRNRGTALVDTLFSAEDIAAGRLVRPFALTVPYGAYFIVTRRFDLLPEAETAFVTWLQARLATP